MGLRRRAQNVLTALALVWRDIRPCPRALMAGVWWLPCRIRAPASGACRFWTTRSKSSDVQPYPMPTVRALAPRFAGSSLFYLSSRGTGDGLWRSSKGEALEIWRGADGTLLEPPAPSPDGQRVSVVLRQQGRPRLGLLAADGAEVRNSGGLHRSGRCCELVAGWQVDCHRRQ